MLVGQEFVNEPWYAEKECSNACVMRFACVSKVNMVINLFFFGPASTFQVSTVK